MMDENTIPQKKATDVSPKGGVSEEAVFAIPKKPSSENVIAPAFMSPNAARVLEPSIQEDLIPVKNPQTSVPVKTLKKPPLPSMTPLPIPFKKDPDPSEITAPHGFERTIPDLPGANKTDQEASEGEIPSLSKEEKTEQTDDGRFNPKEVSDLPTLRTFKKDVAGTIRDQKTSLVRMVLEEQKSRAKRELNEDPRSRKNLPLIFLSFFFLFLTIGLIYFSFFRPSDTEQALTELELTPMITSENIKEISIDGKIPKDISVAIRKEINEGQIKLDTTNYLIFTEMATVNTADGTVQKKKVVPARVFLEKMGIRMPPNIAYSIEDDFFLGYHSFNNNQPFIIMKFDSYEASFSGMLEWEKTILKDMIPIFGILEKEDLSRRLWNDIVIKNKDTRALRDFNDLPVLMYMFKDEGTMILTTNEDTLLEVSRRLDVAQKRKIEI